MCESNTHWNFFNFSSNGGKTSNFWHKLAWGRLFCWWYLGLKWRRLTEEDFCCYHYSNEEYRKEQTGTRRGSGFALFTRRESSREKMPILWGRCSWGTVVVAVCIESVTWLVKSLSGTFIRTRTFAKNQTLRTGQNRIANVRMWFANVRVRISNKRSHAICELRMKWKWAFTALSVLVYPLKKCWR